MIRYTSGNLLEASADALVNTVNEIGVMGKGIALMFKEAFPESAGEYEAAARDKRVHVGRVLVTRNTDLLGPRWIIHFPTKRHWRHPSRQEWIRAGLEDLVRAVREHEIGSIALPPLGCGNGGLDWPAVRADIEAAFSDAPDVDVIVFEPTSAYQNRQKGAGLESLTPARALIAELVRRYSVLGLDCTNLEVQKLAWFMHRSVMALGLDDPLKLEFRANRYGPYADRLRHLLNGLDGSYLHCERRLADAGPGDLIWFEDSKRLSVESYLVGPEALQYRPALERTSDIIEGFQSPLGMELLSTVDWLVAHDKVGDPTVAGVQEALERWPGGTVAARRKLRLFDDRLIRLAIERLAIYERAS